MRNSKIIVACVENLLPVQDLVGKVAGNHKVRLFLTNKYTETLSMHQHLLQQLDDCSNIEVIPNYESALSSIKDKNKYPILLVGDPHHHLHEQIKDTKVITIEEMCSIFPQKVPLSYRSTPREAVKEQVERRLGMVLKKEPTIKNILLTSHEIKMWDESIQVILDLQPATIYVEFEHPRKREKMFKLGMQDFIAALQTCHKVIHGSPLPKLHDFNKNSKHIRWILDSRSLDQSENLLIDEDLISSREQIVGTKARIGRIREEELM